MPNFRKLNNQPLQLVLTEIRFSTVMNIAEYIPRVQDKIRKRYPIFSPPSTERQIHIDGEQIELRNAKQWAFVSKNRKSAVALTENRVVYFTAEYPRFQEFSAIVDELLSVIKDVISPALVSRIGLRYCDLIKPEGDEILEKLVSTDILAPSFLREAGNVGIHKTETITINKAGTLILRTLSGDNNGMLPPDLSTLPIFTALDNMHSMRAILDFDHFWQNEQDQMDFDSTKIIDKLQEMHKPTREAFWNITTDYARDVKWN